MNETEIDDIWDVNVRSQLRTRRGDRVGDPWFCGGRWFPTQYDGVRYCGTEYLTADQTESCEKRHERYAGD